MFDAADLREEVGWRALEEFRILEDEA